MLELTDVDAYYDKSHVLHNLNLDIGDNEIVTLLGRNGAGKTTTISSIMGVETRVEGQITFHGEDITGAPSDEVFSRGISWVPEERRVFTNLTVKENLRMGLINTDGDSDERLADIYDLFPRLKNRLHQKAGTMSGGEQQMLTLARSLLCEPDLLLVDEPYEGLMPKLVDEVADVLMELASKDMAMLMAEQNIEKTLGLADRAYVIENGSIVHEGSAAELQDEELQEELLGVKQ